jgi:hypothetical protein
MTLNVNQSIQIRLTQPEMEDDLNFLENGRRPQLFGKWKTTSTSWKMEDDHNFFLMEDDLIVLENGRRPQLFMNGRRPKLFCKWKATSTIF